MNKNIIINSEKEMRDLAFEFASELQGGQVISLVGDLGAGKTFFVKCIGEFFKVPVVTSPTFAVVNEYTGVIKINHFDFYRINKIEELYDIGFEDYVSDSSAVTFIEWADMFPEIIPVIHTEISITVNIDQIREIKIYEYK
jgi:tRNA threonylcarbamoyladenosine biosynthesis protein TsaE